MRLAIVSPFTPEFSGIVQYGLRLAQGLAQSGRFTSIDVITNTITGRSCRADSDGVAVRRVWRRDHLGAMPAILGELAQIRPDVVWFNLGLSIYGKSPVANFLGHLTPMLARARGLPAIVTLHELFEMTDLAALGAGGHPGLRWGGSLATRFILRANYVCLTLRSYMSVIRQKYGADHVVHMPLGLVNAPRFAPLTGRKRLLYFGSAAPYKGLDGLLDIYQRLRAQDPAIELVVAGSDHQRFPGYFSKVRAAYGHLPGISWLENVPEENLTALFDSARVIALPYAATTGASSAALRAAAHGRPVVAYALRDLKTLAADENFEMAFVPVGDQAAFCRQLLTLLNAPEDCERIGRANVLAMQPHTLEATSQRYADLFSAAVDRQAFQPEPASARRLPSPS